MPHTWLKRHKQGQGWLEKYSRHRWDRTSKAGERVWTLSEVQQEAPKDFSAGDDVNSLMEEEGNLCCCTQGGPEGSWVSWQ